MNNDNTVQTESCNCISLSENGMQSNHECNVKTYGNERMQQRIAGGSCNRSNDCYENGVARNESSLSPLPSPVSPMDASKETKVTTAVPSVFDLRIISATYGPEDGHVLVDGDIAHSGCYRARTPYTRDVLPHVRALLLIAISKIEGRRAAPMSNTTNFSGEGDISDCGSCDKINYISACATRTLAPSPDSSHYANLRNQTSCNMEGLTKGRRRSRSHTAVIPSEIALMDGRSMNEIFGDCCPGTTKRLRIKYIFGDSTSSPSVASSLSLSSSGKISHGNRDRTVAARDDEHDVSDEWNEEHNCVDSGESRREERICRASFVEHERVVLRRERRLEGGTRGLRRTLNKLPRIGSERNKESKFCIGANSASKRRSQSNMAEIFEHNNGLNMLDKGEQLSQPMELTYCDIRYDKDSHNFIDNAGGRNNALLSKSKRILNITSRSKLLRSPFIADEWRLDSALSEIVIPITLPYLNILERMRCRQVCKAWKYVVSHWGVATHVDVNNAAFPKYTTALLKSIISNSYGSLESLFLNNCKELARRDFENAIPHLRKLKQLDISKCDQFVDETLVIIANRLCDTLNVLYMKGLRNVTDVGVIAICERCRELCVLDVSNVLITDLSGTSIGRNLHKLEALYMKDNYKLRNYGIDVITKECRNLRQLTLWGSIRLQSSPSQFDALHHLVLLNLWGCHSMRDNAAQSMGSLKSLRILNVSECHRLTDQFVVNLAHAVPQLQHLHLRYLRLISDVSINAIASGLPSLSFLDLCFCSLVTPPSLRNLLELRKFTLTELRLCACTQIDDRGLKQLTGAITRESVINMLDVRQCSEAAIANDVVHILMSAPLLFDQAVPALFARPARWNDDVRMRLVEHILSLGD